MNIEKLLLRFLKVWFLVICVLLVAVVVISILWVAVFWTPDYTKPFVFDQGLKRLEIEVNHGCGFEVGILFRSKAEDEDDGNRAIRRFFGTSHVHMPARVDIALLNEHGKRVFSVADLGGTVHGWSYGSYGSNPLDLHFDRFYLEPGKYTAMINIRDIDGDFSVFESELFFSENSKITCENSIWDAWIGFFKLAWVSNWSLPSKNAKKNPNNDIVERDMSVVAQEYHKKLVDKRYAEDPECFREAFRESIYKRVVVKGMWPAEAFLAGGGGIYRVKADPKKWEKRAYPRLVMKAQCTDPDDSEIEIDFRNPSQFSGGVVRKFTVRFENGVVTEIKED